MIKLDNVRIIEGGNYLYSDVITYYRSKIGRNDYRLLNLEELPKAIELFSKRPFFSQFYVIEVHLNNITNMQYKLLSKLSQVEHVVLICVVRRKSDFDKLDFCNAFFNGYDISFNYWKGYVVRHLLKEVRKQITIDELKSIHKHIKGNFEFTDHVINLWNEGEKNVKRKIGKLDKINLDKLFFNIIRCDGRKQSFEFIDNYKYGFKFILEGLSDKFDELIHYYGWFREGLLNDSRITTFEIEVKDLIKNMDKKEQQKFSNISKWRLKQYIDIFTNYSFDELLLIGSCINNCEISRVACFNMLCTVFNRVELVRQFKATYNMLELL